LPTGPCFLPAPVRDTSLEPCAPSPHREAILVASRAISDDVSPELERLFSVDTGIYQRRGFQRRVGFGKRPALIHIDLANAWTRPGHAFSCDGMDVIIPAVQ